ncbi:MAG: hypothetical protein JW850_24165 [Thermoflexales bacterium]|nr:hypothetical protein [Thermoflexales bacterium]
MTRPGVVPSIVVIVSLIAGLGLGLLAAWWFPLRLAPASPAALNPMWRADYILMTAQAYSLDGDLATARRRLQELIEADPSDSGVNGDQALGSLVAQRGLEAIAGDMPPEEVGRLARLAAALGVQLPELQPYMVY